ncbi:hypothetical protein GCM10023321_47140 [Pseudonocardia eucalypti]|uniref:MarR family transcriptional regulator n=1 Tax=Pseudonocardia eucalypti TaxID=648755 RepID=A0ABP9QHY6_9PSEU|nr:hypothetical protein [Pseudonocardia eucalypti]
MAESAEHAFLSETAIRIMEESANAQLFSCLESGRKRFDFACNLTRDWTRAVSGQTLWKHDRDGIDKDLRTLLTDGEASAAVYVVRDSMKNRDRVDEIIRDYRNTSLRVSLSKLRIFRVPADFDADDERAREVVRDGLRRDIYQDLLLQVALGGITAQDVRNFASSGRVGSPVWILSRIDNDGYLDNYTNASKRYRMGIPALKEELLRLESAGMVSREENALGLIQVTEKGCAMLDICARLYEYLAGKVGGNKEFLYVCRLLGMDFSTLANGGQAVNFEFYEANRKKLPFGHGADNAALMLTCLYYSSQHGEIEWRPPCFTLPRN